MYTMLAATRGLVIATLIGIGLGLTLISCGDADDPKRLLQLKLYPKDAFILYISGENEIILSNTAMDLGGRFEATYRWDVLSVDPEGNIVFDVSVKSALYPMLTAPLGRAFEDSTFKVHMAADGEILRFEGTDEMRSKVSARLNFPLIEYSKNEGLSAEDYKRDIEISTRDTIARITDEALRGMFEPLFRFWPTVPVAPGDEWTLDRIPTSLPIPNGNSFATANFEVTSWIDGEVTLDMQGTLKTLDTVETNKLSGTTQGTIILDALGGFLKRASFNRDAKGSITLEAGEPDGVLAITLHEEVFVEVLKL